MGDCFVETLREAEPSPLASLEKFREATHNLFDEVMSDIEEGRALYNSRVSPALYPKNFYDRAIVDLLIRGKGHVRSKMW